MLDDEEEEGAMTRGLLSFDLFALLPRPSGQTRSEAQAYAYAREGRERAGAVVLVDVHAVT